MRLEKLIVKRGESTRNRLARQFRDWTFSDARYHYDGEAVRLTFRCSGKLIESHELLAGSEEKRVRDAIDALEAWALEAE